MDAVIASMAGVLEGDLVVCMADGVAYQADMTAARVPYDDGYFAKVCAYEETAIALAVNAGRCALVARTIDREMGVLDYGAGSGAFLRTLRAEGYHVMGFDVMPAAAARLREAGRYADDPSEFEAVTLWDCVEHLEDPETCLGAIRAGAFLFVSLPIFEDLRAVRSSKHYRPGEHLYYWTELGFLNWMARRGFCLLETSSHEVDAGRESIGAFSFVRNSSWSPAA